jgi:molybdate transport system ATP-binding protein
MMLEVAVQHRFGAFALDVAFAAGPGVTALIGPSGAGKSTVLGVVAGLVRANAGEVRFDGRVLQGAGVFVPMHQRRMGVVFQEARLFPHLSVAQNLGYGARMLGIAADVAGVAASLGIAHLLARRPRDLSGGERQRVALGRALLAQPRMLLMDEPLAALDAARKAEILPLIAGIKDVPILYVTHSAAEVEALADRVVRMEEGRVI